MYVKPTARMRSSTLIDFLLRDAVTGVDDLCRVWGMVYGGMGIE